MPPFSLCRMRHFTATQKQYSNDHLLPLYVNVSSVERETLRIDPKSPLSLSKQVISLAFRSALDMFQSQSSSSPSQDQPNIIGATMVVSFAASLSGVFLSHSKPRLAAIVEKAGYLFFAVSFFLMNRVVLSGSFIMWVINWVAWAFTMLAFLIPCLT